MNSIPYNKLAISENNGSSSNKMLCPYVPWPEYLNVSELCLVNVFKGQGMVTSEYIDVDDNGKMINCSPLSYKIPNVRCVPRKFNVTLVREDTFETPVYSAKV